tara:strand:- start:91 stop:192 length:102 start_codon:yes stop_codon:yes gene_type:complete
MLRLKRIQLPGRFQIGPGAQVPRNSQVLPIPGL